MENRKNNNFFFNDNHIHRLFIGFICVLAGSTNIKLGDIQLLEFMIGFSTFYFITKKYVFKDGVATTNRALKVLIERYTLFLLLLFFLAIINLTQAFFIPGPSLSPLKYPLIISMVRIIQLSFVIYGYIYFTDFLYRYPDKIFFFVKSYMLAGTGFSLYAIISCLALKGGVKLGGAYLSDSGGIRANGLFNEGGPFGLYLSSVIIITFAYKFFFRKLSTIEFLLIISIQFLAIILSGSKAGFLCLSLLLFSAIFFSKFKLKSIIPLLLILTGVATFIGIKYYEEFQSYYEGYTYITTMSDSSADSDDANVVMGRIAASHIVPNIILDRPILGVGIGNYSLVRNNPKYLDGLPSVDAWDLSGLGLLGYGSEFGIPLLIFFIFLLYFPIKFSRCQFLRSKSLISMSYFPIISFLMGAQITFFYPWLLSSLCLALAMNLKAIPSYSIIPNKPINPKPLPSL